MFEAGPHRQVTEKTDEKNKQTRNQTKIKNKQTKKNHKHTKFQTNDMKKKKRKAKINLDALRRKYIEMERAEKDMVRYSERQVCVWDASICPPLSSTESRRSKL